MYIISNKKLSILDIDGEIKNIPNNVFANIIYCRAMLVIFIVTDSPMRIVTLNEVNVLNIHCRQ